MYIKKSLIYISLLPILTLLFSGGANAQIRTFSGKNISEAELNNFVLRQMDSLSMPGLSIALISNDQIVYHKAFGATGINTKKPVDEASIF